MRWDRYALLAFIVLIMLSIANTALGTKAKEEEASRNSSFFRFFLTIHPRGFGPIQLGNLKEEVWKKTERDGRFEKVTRRVWEKTPANGAAFASHSCTIYWRFQENVLRKITIHFSSHSALSSHDQLIQTHLIAQEILTKSYGTPTKAEPIDILDIRPGSALCTDRWIFRTKTEIRIMILRHEVFSRIYSVGIEILDSKIKEEKR